MSFSDRHTGGFTLIEILVVISIIGMLAAVIIVKSGSSKDKVRIAKASAFAAQSYRVIANTSRGRWDFDEASGSLIQDSSGNGMDGSIAGPVTRSNDTYSAQGYSLSFNGTSNVVEIPDPLRLMNPKPAISFGGWFKTANPLQTSSLFTKIYGGGYGFVFNDPLAPNMLSAQVDVGSIYYATGIPNTKITANKWHHIFAVYDGSKLDLYFDGALYSSTVTPGGPVFYNNPEMQICIGADVNYPNCSGNYYSGLADEFRVFAKTLVAEDVHAIYLASLDKFLAKK